LARQENQTPVAIADIENISVKFFRKYPLTVAACWFFCAKKGKGGGYYLIKDPKK
jgi:DNA-binding IscR family transcriptional regulator